MRLAVATLCPHYHDGRRWWAYEPYVLEMDLWNEMFQEIRIVAPIATERPPIARPYRASERVSLTPFRRDRGDQRTGALDVPRMVAALLRTSVRTDALLVRSPSNIGVVASLLGPLLWRRRVARYTGQWSDYRDEARSYRLQKRVLASSWWRATTMVYCPPEHARGRLVPSFNSVLPRRCLPAAPPPLPADSEPLRLLMVGRLTANKNVDRLLRALAAAGADAGRLELTVVGEGPQWGPLLRLSRELGLRERVEFTGSLPFEGVLDAYREHHAVVVLSGTEGWPKVLVEGMSFGLPALVSDRGLMPSLVAAGGGWVVPADDEGALRDRLLEIATTAVDAMRPLQQSALRFGRRHTLDDLESHLRSVLAAAWGTEPLGRPSGGPPDSAPVSREDP